MKSSLKYFLIASGAFIFLISLWVAYSEGLKNNSTVDQSNPAPTVLPTSPLSPLDELYVNTKTYVNKQLGFQISFPQEYIDEYEKDRQDISWYLQTIHSSDYRVADEEGPAYTSGSAIFYIGKIESSCKNSYPVSMAESTATQISYKSESVSLFEIKELTNNNHKYRRAYWDISKNKCIEFICNSSKVDCGDNNLGEQFHQMLATIQYVNPDTNQSSTKISPQVSAVFAQVNKLLPKVVEPKKISKDYFYQDGAYKTTQVWYLDISAFGRDKSLATKIMNTLLTDFSMTVNNEASGEGGGEFSYVYENKNVTCLLEAKMNTLQLYCNDN